MCALFICPMCAFLPHVLAPECLLWYSITTASILNLCSWEFAETKAEQRRQRQGMLRKETICVDLADLVVDLVVVIVVVVFVVVVVVVVAAHLPQAMLF